MHDKTTRYVKSKFNVKFTREDKEGHFKDIALFSDKMSNNSYRYFRYTIKDSELFSLEKMSVSFLSDNPELFPNVYYRV